MEPSYYMQTKTVCGKLLTAPFDICKLRVDVSKYHERCVEDRCALNGDGAECLVFAAYALECANLDYVIEWRGPYMCGKYHEYSSESKWALIMNIHQIASGQLRIFIG